MIISRRDALRASSAAVTALSFAALDAVAAQATAPAKTLPPLPLSGRFPELKPEQMYFEQRRVHELVAERRAGGMAGPYVPLTYAPELLEPQFMLGEHARFHTSLNPKLREWAICIGARNVNSWYVFTAHGQLAVRGQAVQDFPRWGRLGPGVAQENVDALAAQRKPEKMAEDEAVVYDFCMEFHNTGGVSDETFARAEKLLGKAGILELIAVYYQYATIGLIANVTQLELPNNPRPPRPFQVPAD